MELKNPVGRPRAITPEIINKLEKAFALGCTNREACFFANVAESTFYDFIKEYPEYSERFNSLKEYEKIRARKVIHDALGSGDRDIAKWYLERKAKDEFSTKQEIVGDVNLNYEETLKKAMSESEY